MSSSASESNIIPTVSLLNDQEAIERIFTHIDKGTTDLGDTVKIRVPLILVILSGESLLKTITPKSDLMLK